MLTDQKVTSRGRITNDGKLSIVYPEEYRHFLSLHKGSNVLITVEISDTDTSEAMKGYYWKVVVPTCQQGFKQIGERLTEKQTDAKLRSLSPPCYKTDYNTTIEEKVQEIEEMTRKTLIEHIDHCIQLSAEEFCLVIESPKVK